MLLWCIIVVWGWCTMSTVYFTVSIEEQLNDKLMAIAAEEGRSKNKQIEFILKKYVKQYEQENGEIDTDKE